MRDLLLRVPVVIRWPISVLLGLALAMSIGWFVPFGAQAFWPSFWIGFLIGGAFVWSAARLGRRWERMGAKSDVV